MSQARLAVAFALIVAVVSLPPSYGQTQGSRPSGRDDKSDYWWANQPVADAGAVPSLSPLDRRVASEYISIDGRAEVRVKPTAIRLVLAVIAEGENGKQCQSATEATIARLRMAWAKIGIEPERIAEDFVAAVPRYEWASEERHNDFVKVEKKLGVRVQTNVHLSARGETEARAAIARAMEQDVTDVVACDYWCKNLDEVKVKARQQALAAARSKAELLLGTLFSDLPPVINVQEQTTVRYPESFYHSFAGPRDNWPGMGGFWVGGPTGVAASRDYTYYRLPNSDADTSPQELSLTPEITVVSTVRLYYKSPSVGGEKKAKPAKKGS
jgi:uncharacterized protein YggE